MALLPIIAVGRQNRVKFIYSKKATKFREISTLLLSYKVPVKTNVEISQNFIDFSEYMNIIAPNRV